MTSRTSCKISKSSALFTPFNVNQGTSHNWMWEIGDVGVHIACSRKWRRLCWSNYWNTRQRSGAQSYI